jgi:putative peptidoglycan lipid II flippase
VSGSLGYVIVPIVAQRLATGDDSAAARVAGQVGLYVTGLSLALSAAAAAGAAPLTAALYPGFASDPQLQHLTAMLLRTLAVVMLLNCLIAYLNALYQAYHRFARPAVAGVVGTLATLVYVVAMHSAQGIFAVAWGVVFGAAVTVAMLLPLFIHVSWQSRSWTVSPDAGTRQCLALLTPLALGALLWRLEPLVDRWLGSYLASGSIAHLGYAWRLTSGLMLIGTSGLSTVAFPAIAAHASAGRARELDREVAHAARFFLVLIIPVCAGLAVFAGPVVRLLLERGKFTSGDTAAVSLLAALYVGAIFGGGLGDLVSRTFYAFHQTRLPVVVSIFVFLIAIGLKFILARSLGAAGLAAATSLYYVLNAGVLTALLLRQRSYAILEGASGTLVRALAGSAAACGAAALVMRLPLSWAVLPAAAAGALVYFASMWLMQDEFARRLLPSFPRRSERC